jgi:glycine betaine catabolism B
LRTRLNNFQYYILLSQPPSEWSGPKGRVNREFVESKIKEPASNCFFVCGPGSFMDAAGQILSSLGVAPEKIIQESFGSPPPSGDPQDPAITETAATVEFVRSKKTHSARQGQTLLQAAEQCGVNIPSGCRQGQCGTCKVKLLAGAMDAEQGLSHDLKGQGFVLTCVGHAKGQVKLDA